MKTESIPTVAGVAQIDPPKETYVENGFEYFIFRNENVGNRVTVGHEKKVRIKIGKQYQNTDAEAGIIAFAKQFAETVYADGPIEKVIRRDINEFEGGWR